MTDFINGLIAFALRPLRELSNAIIDRLSALWSSVTNFFTRVRNSFTGWIGSASSWVSMQIYHAAATLTTLRWLIFTYVPRRLGDLAASIVAWTMARISDAIDYAIGQLNAFRDWIIDRVNEVIGLLVEFRNWTFARIAEARANIKTLFDHVFGVLGSPQRLANWIVGAMATALLGYILDNAVPWGRALVGARVQVALDATQRAEDIVSRII